MKLTKMHGLGNDFILTDARSRMPEEPGQLARRLCGRHTGVGADGLICVCPSTEADIMMRIFNADGSEAEMCGNGIRCFARYVYEQGILPQTEMSVQTLGGVMRPRITKAEAGDFQVCVDMGLPDFNPNRIPMDIDMEPVFNYRLKLADCSVAVQSLLMGVPHTIVFVDDTEAPEISALGPQIEGHPVFLKRTNVNFVQVLDAVNIRVRTYERGAGWTLACGTGSCASVVVCSRMKRTARMVSVHLALGTLAIEYTLDGNVLMTGPAERVFDCEV